MMKLLRDFSTGLALLVALAALAGPLPAVAGGLSLPDLALRERATRDDMVWILMRLPGVSTEPRSPAWLAGTAASPPAPVSYEDAGKALEKRGLFDRQFAVRPGLTLTRGDAAVPFARYLGLRGGASGRFFGVGRRVAYRQMVDLGLMPAGGERAVMTGAELIGVLDLVRQRVLKKGGKP